MDLEEIYHNTPENLFQISTEISLRSAYLLTICSSRFCWGSNTRNYSVCKNQYHVHRVEGHRPV